MILREFLPDDKIEKLLFSLQLRENGLDFYNFFKFSQMF